MDEIRAQAEAVAEARDHYAGAKSLVDDSHKEWLETTAVAHEGLADAQKIMVEAEVKLRDIALAAYLESQDKHPGPGVEIKVRSKLDYDPAKALEWAKEHGLALGLDVRAFEHHAKADPVPCVVYRDEATVALATNMRKALEVKEGK